MHEAVLLLQKIGFDAVSFNWKNGIDHTLTIQTARALGMHIQYLHAPQGAYHTLWTQRGPDMLQQLLCALDDCHKWSIPLYVMHVCSDFVEIMPDLSIGAENFGCIIEKAGQYGIAVALENTARPSYLKTLLDLYQDIPHVGYCWDSGHEQCYTPQEDFLASYGDRLMVTHLNDNMGMHLDRPDKNDDLHLLPQDGIADWTRQIERLKKAKPVEILNFELKRVSKPTQKVRLYDHMTPEYYFNQAFLRAKELEAQYFTSSD